MHMITSDWTGDMAKIAASKFEGAAGKSVVGGCRTISQQRMGCSYITKRQGPPPIPITPCNVPAILLACKQK